MSKEVILPKQKIYKTPMPLKTDAYTVGSPSFQSDEAIQNSVYYATHRKSLNPGVDDRIVIAEMGRTIESIFREACTLYDVEESVNSLKTFKVSTKGFSPYPFPKDLWLRVVNEFNGRPPIEISAVPDGSVVYPNEPFVQVRPSKGHEGFGELAAWFETKILQSYGCAERVTRNEHFLEALKEKLRGIDNTLTESEIQFHAENMLVDFGDRAGLNQVESEDLGMVHLYTFPGTDNLSGHYQAYKNSGDVGQGCSILALAHRNPQAYSHENVCYMELNEVMEDGDLGSFVADLNCYKTAIDKYLIPIVLRNVALKNGKIVVFRPDSGDVKEQLLWTLKQAEANHLVATEMRGNVMWKSLQHCKLILADGLTMADMLDIIDLLTEHNYEFHKTLLFGSGGGLRNLLKRDNLSSKYALNAKGLDNKGVCKFSEDLGKTTLPGPFKLLRSKEALERNETIVHESEPGESILIVYFDGANIWKPFGPGMDDDFPTIKARIREQMSTMPKFNKKAGNSPHPASEFLLKKRADLKSMYVAS